MKGFFLGLLLIGAGFGGASLVTAATDQLANGVAVNFARNACRFGADNIRVASNPNGALSATGLQAATRYRVFCAQATYFDQEPSAGTGAATSADAQIAANSAVEVWTKQNDYISFLSVAATGTCDVLECQ